MLSATGQGESPVRYCQCWNTVSIPIALGDDKLLSVYTGGLMSLYWQRLFGTVYNHRKADIHGLLDRVADGLHSQDA